MTVTVAPTVEPSTGPDDPWRVRLDVTATAGETAATVTRLNPDGTTTPVRTTDGNPLPISGGVALAYDYEAPFGTPVTYSTLETPGTLSDPVTLDEDRPWLIHVGLPTLSRPIHISEFGSRKRAVARGVHYVMGRRYPVTQTDGQRKAPESVLVLRTYDDTERADLDTILDDASPLFLNIPATLAWGVDAAYIDVGDTDEARLVDHAYEPSRYVTLPYVVTDRPAGGTQAERTLADVGAPYATLAELGADYGTLFDMGAGQ